MAVCALCKAGNLKPTERYRLQQSEQRTGGPTELYSQLRMVAGDDLPARLCSEFVCKSCNRNIITAAKQKERFENSRKELVEKLHGVSASSVLPYSTQTAEGMVKTPPHHSDKRPRPSPLARTGVSPLAKRPLSNATNLSLAVAQNRILPVKPAQVHLTTRSRVARRELFPSTSLATSPTKSGASYSPFTSMGQFTLSSQDTFQQKVSIYMKIYIYFTGYVCVRVAPCKEPVWTFLYSGYTQHAIQNSSANWWSDSEATCTSPYLQCHRTIQEGGRATRCY